MGKIERLAELSAEAKERFKYTHFTEITMWDKINELVDSVNDMEYIHDLSPAHKKEPEKPCKHISGGLGACPKCGLPYDEINHPKPSPEKGEMCQCKPDRKGQKPSTPEGVCPKCHKSHGTAKPSPTSLYHLIHNLFIKGGYGKELDHALDNNPFDAYLAQAIRQFIRGEIEQCLTENDSSTHIIAKDLYEKLGI